MTLLLMAAVVVFTQIGDADARPKPDAPARMVFGFRDYCRTARIARRPGQWVQ